MERSRRKKQKKRNKEIVKTSVLKIIVLLIFIGLNWTGLLAVGRTLAYYFDNEDSVNNSFQAAMLDFSATNKYVEDFIGIEAASEIESVSVVTKTTGSLDVQYEVNAEKISGNDDFCNALQIGLEHNGVEKHDGPLLSVNVPATTQLGTWEFEIDLPASANNVLHGVECNVDLIFKGWRADVVNFEDSGFTDEERINLRLTSRMVVLNEFLPNPNGLVPDYGFDFGDDASTKPQGEWVELYNNSNTSHDLDGWYIWDASGDNSNKILITNSNTQPGTTIISGKSWLVVYMNKAVLNNTGDTVKLFDETDTLIDSYTYTADNDYCEIEPTPGDENTTDTAGSCGGVPPNKSYARIPDGIGYWVDPIPTPGKANILGALEFWSTEILNQEEIVQETVETQSTEEPPTEEPPIEEPPTEEPSPTEEQIPAEETTETSGETTEDVIEEVIEGTGEETTDETIIEETVEEVVGETVEESVSEPEAPIIEETSVDEAPITEPTESSSDIQIGEEQPATVPDDNSSVQDGSAESGSSGGSGDGGGDTSGSSDSSSPAEGAGESSGESGGTGDTISE